MQSLDLPHDLVIASLRFSARTGHTANVYADCDVVCYALDRQDLMRLRAERSKPERLQGLLNSFFHVGRINYCDPFGNADGYRARIR